MDDGDKDALDRVRQKGGPLMTKRAHPITPTELLRAMDKVTNIRVQRTLLLIVVSASRHMNLLRVHNWTNDIVRGVLMLIVEIIVETRPLRNQGLQQFREHSAAFQASLQGVDTRQLRGSVQRSEKDLLRSLRSLAQQGRLFPAGLRGIAIVKRSPFGWYYHSPS